MTAAVPIPAGHGRQDLLKKFGWSSLASVVQMLAGIASVIVLTRFLSPSDYGLYGIALMADAWRAISISSFPMLAGLSAIAPILVPMAVGSGFASVGMISAITVLAYLRVVAPKVNIAATQAAGKSLSASASIATSVAAHLVLLVTLAPFGVIAIALAGLLRGWLTWPFAAWFVKAMTGFSLRRQAVILMPPFFASLLLEAGVFACSSGLQGHLNPAVALIVLIPTGILLYAGLLWLFDPWVRQAVASPHVQRYLHKAGTP